MKEVLLGILFTLIVGTSYSQPTVAADSLKYYDGQVITVCHTVSSTFVTKGETKTTFLNFGTGFPNQLFTVVIFKEDLPNFSYNPAEYLSGKNVCIIGDVRMYDSGPEIIVESDEQIIIHP